MKTSADILPPDAQTLLLLCKPGLNEDEVILLKKLLHKISDWSSFVNLINNHGIIALSYYHLKQSGLIGLIPPSEAEMLHQGYLKSLARNTAIFSLFDEVATIARYSGIKIIPIKGLYLEKCIYGNKGLRQMNDLDILVSQGDAMKMRNALLENGYKTIPFISPIHSFFLHSYGKHMPEMYHKGLNVEIHFRLFRDRHNAFTREMVNLASEPFPGGNAFTFSPPEMHHFMYLVKHLLWHEKTGNSQLRLWCDLVFLVNKYWHNCTGEEFYQIAERLKMREDLKNVLLLLKKYFGVAVHVSGVPPEKADLKFRKFLFSPKNNSPEERKGPFMDQIENIEGIYHKILYAAGMLFPSLTFMKWRYNTDTKIKAFLYYPKRWLDFLIKIL